VTNLRFFWNGFKLGTGKLVKAHFSYSNGAHDRSTWAIRRAATEHGYPGPVQTADEVAVATDWLLERGQLRPYVTIYRTEYCDMPGDVFAALKAAELTVENNSDGMTDYFENDRIAVSASHPLFAAVLNAYLAQEERRIPRLIRRGQKTDIANTVIQLYKIRREHCLSNSA
jgi:hypothetical protein